MSARPAQADIDTQRETRKLERQRFLKQQRIKPSFWLATTEASLKYGINMSVIALVVIPPAIFYWSALVASIYELTAINEILSHVALGAATASADTMTNSGADTLSELARPTIDTIGIAIWALTGMIFAVIGWFVVPFNSPLQKAADKHMMEWSGPALKPGIAASENTSVVLETEPEKIESKAPMANVPEPNINQAQA